MKRTVIAVFTIGALFALTVVAQKPSTPEAQLGAIIQKAEGEGNFEAAIPSYKKFLADNSKNKVLSAKAQYHLGYAYEKLGNTEARKVYEQLVHDYPKEPIAADAKQRLTVLTAPFSNSLAPRLICSKSEECNFHAATISADGRLIAFRDDGGLSLRDLETRKVTILTKFNAEARPDALDMGNVYPAQFAISPDNRHTAYGWSVESNHVQLRVVSNEANAKPRILVDNKEFTEIAPKAWTNDGKILVTLVKPDRTWQLAWVSVADGAVKPIKSLGWRFPPVAGGPSLSPDGRTIAYAALPSNPSSPGAGILNGPRSPGDTTDRHIYVLAADGSGSEIEVVNDGNLNLFPTWMPDGKNLLFVSNRLGSSGLWSVAVQDASASGGPVQVKSDVGDIRVAGMTRSGSYYYEKLGKDYPAITVVNLDKSNGNSGVRLTEKTIVGAQAAWSPDGRRIAAIKTLTGIGSANGPVLTVHSVDSADERLYLAPRGVEISPRLGYPLWSHDGKAIFLLARDDTDGVSLYRVDLTDLEFKEILPRFSQDGVLSPDDKTLYVIAQGEAPTPSAERVDRIKAIDLNSRQQKEVSNVSGVELSSTILSPDGQTLYLKTSCAGPRGCRSIMSIDLATGKQKQILTVQDPDSLPTPCKLALSADGHTIAVIVNQTRGSRLVQIGVDGSDQRTVYSATTQLWAPVWTRDGAAVMVSMNSLQQIVRIPASGGDFKIVRSTNDLSGSNFSLSPDGLRIAINGTGSTPSELWALDNVSAFLKTAR